VAEQGGDEYAVMGKIEAVRERLLKLGDLRPHPAAGELGQRAWVADTGKQRLQHRPCRDRVGL